ncbi:hypothetical protein JHK82_022479 [Glycine max]|nr:hypothetical protein JHK85_022970 [Glycine max]KAG5137748.1 hypothetical protein JHK82_022479 [Glycine max]
MDENVELDAWEIEYVSYGGEQHLPLVMNLVDQELSEPYSIFTYRYFVYLWPQLSFLVLPQLFHFQMVCKMGNTVTLSEATLSCWLSSSPTEEEALVTLEAEVTNKGALALYGRLGFIRAKRLFHYYLNGVDAFRLKLLFPRSELHPSLPMMSDKYESHMQSDHGDAPFKE